MSDANKVDYMIVSGFLGAGKTTTMLIFRLRVGIGALLMLRALRRLSMFGAGRSAWISRCSRTHTSVWAMSHLPSA